jgi:hypothetical protein
MKDTPPKLLVAQEIASARAVVCAACPHVQVESDRCPKMSCGCSLKQRQASTLGKCPLGKWTDTDATATPAPMDTIRVRAAVCIGCDLYSTKTVESPCLSITVGRCPELSEDVPRTIRRVGAKCPKGRW